MVAINMNLSYKVKLMGLVSLQNIMAIFYFQSLYEQLFYRGFHKYNSLTAVPVQCNIPLRQQPNTQDFYKIKIHHYRRHPRIAWKQYVWKFGMMEHC
jgi:hypothetical protein